MITVIDFLPTVLRFELVITKVLRFELLCSYHKSPFKGPYIRQILKYSLESDLGARIWFLTFIIKSVMMQSPVPLPIMNTVQF